MLQNTQKTNQRCIWNISKNKATFFLLLCLVILQGCSVSPIKGPNFQSSQLTSNDKGLVYVYWLGLNERIDFSINAVNKIANEDIDFNMKRGGYFVFESSPGDLHLESSANFTFGQMALLDMALTFDEELNFDIVAGEKYYVRCSKVGQKGSYKLKLDLVHEGIGRIEIRKTKLVLNE